MPGAAMAMSSKAEQYRCYGDKALASAKQATCEEEKAELLEIAEAWFKLAGSKMIRQATRNRRQSPATDECKLIPPKFGRQ